MMETPSNVPALPPVAGAAQPGAPVSGSPLPDSTAAASQRRTLIIIVVVAVVILALLVAGTVGLVTAGPATTGLVRDIFIIFMALEAFVLGVALVILIIQLSILINLLQNEIKPILNSTQETVNTLKGTVTFLSDNLSEPVIKMNEYMAAIKRFIEIIRPPKR